MTDLSMGSRRLTPGMKAGLGLFARYATILGLVAMVLVFSLLSPSSGWF